MAVILQSWVPFALFATIGLLGYNICAKMGGGNLLPVMFASVMYTAGFIAMIPLFFWYMHDKPMMEHLQSLPLIPVLFAAGAGLVVILVDTSISAMFNRNAPIGIAMPAINVGCLALTVLIGIAVFRENMSLINATGILLALISLPLMFYSTK